MSSDSDSSIDGPMGRRVMAEMPVILPPGDHRGRPRQPQKKVDDFWRKFTTKTPGKATALLPKTSQAETLAQRATAKDTTSSAPALASYDEAAALCRAKVDKIIQECRRLNQKYRDPHFDLEFDLKTGRRDCLESLDNIADSDLTSDSDSDSGGGSPGPRPGPRPPQPYPPPPPFPRPPSPARRHRHHRQGERHPRRRQDRAKPGAQFTPKSVARVSQIFDAPQFFIDGPTANDVRQGRDGDCWLMAALCTMSDKPGLIERICVARDEAVGVYGFVFHRDGGWFSEIIDDKLFLTKPDYDEAVSDRPNIERMLWEDGRERVDSDEVYRRAYQSNSGALYFAQCEEANETWLPLLEKAYAKAHGDYATLEGGCSGEGVEDLTGGVTSEIFIGDILDREAFWKEEMLQVNKEFLFGCSTGLWGRGWGDRKGIVEQHAYSIMKAVEMDGERLLLLKNPWGKSEWKGAWSDGSKEWTPEWLQKLGHRFGDDGAFWISYKDLLRKYQNFDRTRLFDDSWKVASLWTTLSVPWTIEYHDTKFVFQLDKPGPVVIVLSQLDDRYFRGLEGQYMFSLAFRVHKAGHDDYLVRTQGSYRMKRSVNVELELEAGEYVVLVKIDADRFDELIPAEDMVRRNAKYRREKLLRIALAYDLAHSKAKIVETDEEKAAREAYEKRKKEKYRERMRKSIMKEKERIYYQKDKQISDMRKVKAKKKERRKERMERKEKEARKKEEEMREEMEKARMKWEADKGPTVEMQGKSADDKPKDDGPGDDTPKDDGPGDDTPKDGEVGGKEKGVETDVEGGTGAKSEAEPKKTQVEIETTPGESKETGTVPKASDDQAARNRAGAMRKEQELRTIQLEMRRKMEDEMREKEEYARFRREQIARVELEVRRRWEEERRAKAELEFTLRQRVEEEFRKRAEESRKDREEVDRRVAEEMKKRGFHEYLEELEEARGRDKGKAERTGVQVDEKRLPSPPGALQSGQVDSRQRPGEGRPVAAGSSEGAASTDPGENTPPTSSSAISATAPSASVYHTPAGGSNVEDLGVELEGSGRERDSPDTVKDDKTAPAGDAQPETKTDVEKAAEKAPTTGQTPTSITPQFEAKLQTVLGALEAISSFKDELKNVLGDRGRPPPPPPSSRGRGGQGGRSRSPSRSPNRPLHHGPRDHSPHHDPRDHSPPRGLRGPSPNPFHGPRVHSPPPPHRIHSPPPPPRPFPGGGGPGGFNFNADDSDRDDLISLGTVSDVTDRELDYRVEDSLRHMRGMSSNHRGGGGPPVVSNHPPSHHGDRRRGGEDRFERDPWNAVAVVGLRVYYKVAEGDKDKEIVRLRVVRPNPYELKEEEEEGEKGEEKKEGEEGADEAKVLDLDDSAKDATVIG